MNRRVHAKGFPDDRVENVEVLHLFILHCTELSFTCAEELDLFIINGLTRDSGSIRSLETKKSRTLYRAYPQDAKVPMRWLLNWYVDRPSEAQS
jgi:hypothetical protein